MNRRALTHGLIVAVCVVLFAAGVAQLFSLRAGFGEAYPLYSSFRSDPMGVKAFYEGLAALDSVRVRRNLRPFREKGFPLAETASPDVTIFCLGATVDGMSGPVPETEFSFFERMAEAGARVVISFVPVAELPWEFSEVIRKKADDSKTVPPEVSPEHAPHEDSAGAAREGEEEVEEEEEEEPGDGDADTAGPEDLKQDSPFAPKQVTLEERWGLALAFADLQLGEDKRFVPCEAVRTVTVPLPDSIPCKTALYFDMRPQGEAEGVKRAGWETIYSRGARSSMPVIIERAFGKGTIVLCADSYLFSNEAMRSDRRADLLAWCAGHSREVVFDETHLGVTDTPGVMALARKYRLHGVFATLAVLAALFVWKNARPLAPPLGERPAEGAGFAAGRDSAAGLMNLLRRSVDQGQVVHVCFDEWHKSRRTSHDPRMMDTIARMQSRLDAERHRDAKKRDAVRLYQELCGIVQQKEWHGGTGKSRNA